MASSTTNVSVIGYPPVSISMEPFTMLTMAMVVIREGIPILATTKPLMLPITPHTASASIMARNRFTPEVASFMITAPERAATAPTDISKFPDMMTKVIPADMMPIMEDCLSRFNIFLWLANAGVAMVIITHRARKPMTTPYSLKFIFSLIRFPSDIFFTPLNIKYLIHDILHRQIPVLHLTDSHPIPDHYNAVRYPDYLLQV